MSESEGDSNALESGEVVTACLVIEQRMDSDGEMGQYVSVTSGLPLVSALGMLEYAKMQLINSTSGDGD